MALNFPSTILVNDNSHTSINKGIIDILDKVNQVAASTASSGSTVSYNSSQVLNTTISTIFATTGLNDLTFALPKGDASLDGITFTLIKIDTAAGTATFTANTADNFAFGPVSVHYQGNGISVKYSSSNNLWSITDLTPIVNGGTNSNGSYVQYSDGTMQQWGSITASFDMTTACGGIFYVNSSTYNFPTAFINTAYSWNADTYDNGTGMPWFTGASFSTSQFQFRALHPTSNTLTLTVRWTATGKWK